MWFTPHARGSTALRRLDPRPTQVYPACAGIDLFPVLGFVPLERLPRMRGDRPGSKKSVEKSEKFTPHARGSTIRLPAFLERMSVYPACAGIDLVLSYFPIPPSGLPRMRGDRPGNGGELAIVRRFTPHARGSTLFGPAVGNLEQVYPACAGIDPQYTVVLAKYAGLPRMRGDRPLRD